MPIPIESPSTTQGPNLANNPSTSTSTSTDPTSSTSVTNPSTSTSTSSQSQGNPSSTTTSVNERAEKSGISAEQAAEKLYAERMEEEYAKREGGA
ncbi:MAG: hypothetical protein M1817_006872 [Caeruleum heppii]|nr:MAG: hypothetical protein M1817_006872 [Caeruleum heppii]